jgi:hypothetical protein
VAFLAPIGLSDFRALRRQGATYVDKTRLISEVLATPAAVFQLLRPRRFGKTLNLSTARYFFERSDEDRRDLFEGLAVWGDERARAHFQRYPVVFLTFKDVKYGTWADCRAAVAQVIAKACRDHAVLLEGDGLAARDAEFLSALLEERASEVDLAGSLERLSALLHAGYGEPVVLLVDEYDTPIHAAFTHGYYDEAIRFFRNFLSGGFKDNPHLFKGIVTGILRVAKESIFSGLNNLAVHSILSVRFATDFGFTTAEVEALARLAGAEDQLDGLRAWYDGYLFGGQVIFNPWSVLNYLANLADGLRPYWAQTSANDLVQRLLLGGGLETSDLETLLRGGSVDMPLDESLVLRDLERRPEAVWSLLLFSGYLKGESIDGGLRPHVRLSLPNREVESIFRTAFAEWLEAGLGGGKRVRAMLRAMIDGDTEAFGHALSELVRRSLSFHDVGGSEPERVYQAFVVGLLVALEPEYDVRSNRESGLGRCDVMVVPRVPGRAGVVLELKSLAEGEAPERALEGALRQIRERDYAAELRARGAAPVREIAVVFDGKRVVVGGR